MLFSLPTLLNRKEPSKFLFTVRIAYAKQCSFITWKAFSLTLGCDTVSDKLRRHHQGSLLFSNIEYLMAHFAYYRSGGSSNLFDIFHSVFMSHVWYILSRIQRLFYETSLLQLALYCGRMKETLTFITTSKLIFIRNILEGFMEL